MRNIARCGTVHGRPESAFTITGIRRSTGPRIIALLTAELVIAGQYATEEQEAIFSAAEELADADFERFIKYISEVEAKLESTSKDVTRENGGFRIMVEQQTTTSSWPSRQDTSLATLDLATYLGPWARKLNGLGLVREDIKERQWNYPEDTERHIDEPGTAREISWWLVLEPSAVKLASFAKRAGKNDV